MARPGLRVGLAVQLSTMHRLRTLLGLSVLLCTLSGVAGERPAEIPLQAVGPFGGDVRSLAVHPAKPDTFFLGTADGQIFKSTDAGQRWVRLLPGLGRRNLVVDNFHFHPHSPDILYAGAWETKSDRGWFFVTLDGGLHWQEIPLGLFQSSIRAIAIAPSNPSVIALGISEGVILSQDGGQNWDRITRGYRSLHNVESLVFDPHDSQALYVGTWRRGWKTLNRGKKWIPIHQGMAFDSDMFSLLVSPDDSSTLYSSACSGVYKSLNSGDNWVKLSNGLPHDARRTRMLHLDPNDSQILYAGTTLGLYRTKNGGDSFREILPQVVINAIAVHPSSSDIVLVGTDDAGVFRSTDGGATFELSNQGFSHRQISVLAASSQGNGRSFAAVSADGGHGGFFYAQGGSLDWIRYNQGLDPSVASVIRAILPSSTSPQVLLLAGNGIYRGIPGQFPWRQVRLGKGPRIRAIAWTNQEQDLLLASDEGLGRLDLKTLRLRKLTIPVYKGPVYSVVSDLASQTAFAGTQMGVFESADSGRSWQIRARGMPYASVELLKLEGGRLYAATTHGLYVSHDRGQSWKQAYGVSQSKIADLAAHSSASSPVFAADLLGELFRSNDGGQGWSRVDLGASPSRVSALLLTPSGSLLAGTLSDGLYLISKQVVAKGVEESKSPRVKE